MAFALFLMLKKTYVIIGMNNNATARETNKVEIIETPMCFPNNPMKKLVEKTNGRNTVTVVRVAAIIDLATSLVP